MRVSQRDDGIRWNYSVGSSRAQVSTGMGDIELNDSLETVLGKIGFSNATSIAKRINGTALIGYSTVEEAESAISFRYSSTKPDFQISATGYSGSRLDDGRWVLSGITISLMYPGDNFDCSYGLQFRDDRLENCEAFKGRFTRPSSSGGSEYIYGTADPGVDVTLNTERLNEVTDLATAAEAVHDQVNEMTQEQKNSATGIDLATLYAETAVTKAASKPFTGNDILVNAAAVAGLEAEAAQATNAVDTALVNGGITTARYLSTSVTLTTDSSS